MKGFFGFSTAAINAGVIFQFFMCGDLSNGHRSAPYICRVRSPLSSCVG